MRFETDRLIVTSAALLLLSCGGGVTTTGDTAVTDALETTAQSETIDVPADLGGMPDVDLDRLAEAVDEAGGPPACVPGTGCFLDPCTDNSQCLSGGCIEHMGQGVCSQACVEECPDGFECKQIGETGVDIMFACVSTLANLCKPCAVAADCESVGGAQDYCVAYGPQGSFCGGNCGKNGACPDGFECQSGKTVDGLDVEQCVKVDGECGCTDLAMDKQLWTECFVQNEWGKCTGKRVCGEEGLSACDASTPAQETCDGVDNDCDGDVDEPAENGGDLVNLCDDANPCTVDSCEGEEGCKNPPAEDGTECQDGDPCSVADHCTEGTCGGTPVVCQDDNPCTDDSCGIGGGCVFEPNVAKCDDGDPCTVADQCDAGACKGVAVSCDCQADADCAKLEDGNLCNGTLFCNQAKLPYQCAVKAGTEVVCPDPDGKDAACLVAACVPESGECTFAPTHEGLPCGDQNACTLGDVCVAGACTGQAEVVCNDSNPCTDDACLPDKGCAFTPNSLPCDDLNACTVGDACSAGACIGQGALECNDFNPCTDDGCLPDSGCFHTPNTAPCNDSNACTSADQCADGMCSGLVPVVCSDGNPCTDDGCDPQAGCTFKTNSSPCDDNNTCTTGDVCVNGICKGSGSLECDDKNPCTKDICLPGGGCAHENISVACTDGDACTVNDFCKNGKCLSGAVVTCDDKNGCTDDSCVDGVCKFAPNTQACDDGNVCTENDLCSEGACGGAPKDCNDKNPCTTDWCDPKSGCKSANISSSCDDGNACTVGDFCKAGECLGGPALDCDDENPCTDDSCDSNSGCAHGNNTAPCSDGNACTVDDECLDGACIPGQEASCDDGNVCTDDSCDSVKGCVNAPNSAGCDDGSACTTADQCLAGKCKGGAPLDCNDGLLCTVDGCDAALGCTHVLLKPCCGNGIVEAPEACDDGNHANNDDCTYICQLPTCNDTFANGKESDVDCGGVCPKCADGKKCVIHGDCASYVCTGGICQVPACDDNQPNGDETDLDCGGPCPPCADGLGCIEDKDCESQVCDGDLCQEPACDDGVKNGDETDLDCGALCPGCAPGLDCVVNQDCASKICTGGKCATPTCDDKVKNGTETGVDCGGSCAPCGHGVPCNLSSDCIADAVCHAGKCSLYGTGVDGVLNVTSGTTTINTQHSSAQGIAAAKTASIDAAAPGFAAGRRVLFHQTMGEGAGQWEEKVIQSRQGGTLTLTEPLKYTYKVGGNNRAQAVVVMEYTDVTVSGGTLAAPAFNGNSGGILAFLATGKLVVSGSGAISMNASGFRGSSHGCFYRCADGISGESASGPVGTGGAAPARNGQGGGGGNRGQDCAAGGGGGYGSDGSAGANGGCGTCAPCPNLGGLGGLSAGNANTGTLILFGGAGGEGGGDEDGGNPGAGGNGGGIVIIKAVDISIAGNGVTSHGGGGANGNQGSCGGWGCGMAGGGGGAGGGMYFVAQTAALGSSLIKSSGGGGGVCTCGGYDGGTGGVGRIAVKGAQITGTTVPAYTKFDL